MADRDDTPFADKASLRGVHRARYFRERAHRLADAIPQQIFIANSGAALATLSFFGASVANGQPAKIALVPLSLFLIGICASTGFLVTTAIALKDDAGDPGREKLVTADWASVLAVLLALVGFSGFVAGSLTGVLLLAFG